MIEWSMLVITLRGSWVQLLDKNHDLVFKLPTPLPKSRVFLIPYPGQGESNEAFAF